MNDLKNNETRITITITHTPVHEPSKVVFGFSVGDAVSRIDGMKDAVDALIGVAAHFAAESGLEKSAVMLGAFDHIEQKYKDKEDTNA